MPSTPPGSSHLPPVDSAADPLGILTATREVMLRGAQVGIDREQVDAVAETLAATPAPAPEWGAGDAATEGLHYRDGTWRTVAWVLVLDALNFCFWAQGDDPEARWRVEFRGEIHDGYWALAAALTRAVEEGFPLWDPAYLAGIPAADLATILRPADPAGAPKTTPVPLFPERIAHLRELGRGLTEGGQGGEAAVLGLLAAAGGSAAELARLVAARFPSFADVATYDGRRVPFYKRAQILVADLHGVFGGERPSPPQPPLSQSWERGGFRAVSQDWEREPEVPDSPLPGLGEGVARSAGPRVGGEGRRPLAPLVAFHDLEALTAFADYKVPQVLRRFGILAYAPELAGRIARREPIPAGSAAEVEIRAATVWACELLRRAVANRDVTLHAFEVDWSLWTIGQTLPPGVEPYHRTRTIYY